MTLFGVERAHAGLIALLAMMIWLAFHTFVGAGIVMVTLFAFARWAEHLDPHMMQFILESKHRVRRYDPAKHEPVEVGVR